MIVKEVENYVPINKFKEQIFLSTNYDNYQTTNNPTESALINYSTEYKNNKYKKRL